MIAETLKTAFARALLVFMKWMRASGLYHLLFRWPAARRRYLVLYTQLVARVVKADHPYNPPEVEFEPIEMGTLVKNVAARFEVLLADKNAKLTFPKGWPTAIGYAPWVKMIWEIYLKNALRYGGVPPIIQLGWEELSNNQLKFWVTDNGKNLSDGEVKMVFRQFVGPKPKHEEAIGLGLPIVARIAERLGGEVGVESQLGKGSTFWFTLPKAT